MDFIGLPSPDAAVLAGAVLVGLALDLAFGEPPARVHPVVAMGYYLGAAGRRVSRPVGDVVRPMVEFWRGALGWYVGAALVVAVAVAAVWAVQDLHPLVQARRAQGIFHGYMSGQSRVRGQGVHRLKAL